MSESHLFEYAVIRVVPRVEREEFLNVGVILYCAKLNFLKAIFENKINEQVQSMAAWVLVKIKEIVKEYQVLLMGNLLPLT